MKIPISNSIYMGDNNRNFVKSKKINLNILNSLNLQKIRIKKDYLQKEKIGKLFPKKK